MEAAKTLHQTVPEIPEEHKGLGVELLHREQVLGRVHVCLGLHLGCRIVRSAWSFGTVLNSIEHIS